MSKYETTIERLSATEVRIERLFDAPRELVWEAYTDPECMAQWLGPRSVEIIVDEVDMRPGGSYRYRALREGQEWKFFGEFREVEPPGLLVSTFAFEGMDGSPSVDRLELEDLDDGRTRLVATSILENEEQCEAMLQSGMEVGVKEGYEKLDELLERLVAVRA